MTYFFTPLILRRQFSSFGVPFKFLGKLPSLQWNKTTASQVKLWLLETSVWCEPPFCNVLCLGFSTACQPHNAGAQWSCWVNETSHLLQLTQQLPAVLIQLGSLCCHGLHVLIFTLPETPTQQYRSLYRYMSAWNTNTVVQVALHVYVSLKHQHSSTGYFTCIHLPETPTQ